MSNVTNILLMGSVECIDDLDDFNAALRTSTGGAAISFAQLGGTGNKALEVMVAVGAFNYAPIDAIIETFLQFRWQGRARMFIAEQHQDEFQEIKG
jgi:uncharacterized iron-regulated membrane protein